MSEMLYIEKMGYKVTDSSFRECIIDIGNIKEGMDALTVYPQLKEYREFLAYDEKFPTDEYSNTRLICFIVAMYDRKSPFSTADYQERKMLAAEWVGFRKTESGSFSEAVQKVLNCELDIVRAMIIKYCRMLAGPEFLTYVMFEINYMEKVLMSPKFTIASAQADLKILMEQKNKILAGDKTPVLERHFYKVVEEEEKNLVKLRPEYQTRYWEKKINL